MVTALAASCLTCGSLVLIPSTSTMKFASLSVLKLRLGRTINRIERAQENIVSRGIIEHSPRHTPGKPRVCDLAM
ncbi:hypothetical protein SprV_0200695300 [Sparganum proliferum]